jgi:oxygen-independent coproporphyrinogen-3 oxidase
MKKLNALEKAGLLKIEDKKIELTKLGAFFADEVVTQFSDKKYLPYAESEYAHGELSPYQV